MSSSRFYYIYAVTRTMDPPEWNDAVTPVSKQFEPKKYKDGVQRLKQENSAVFTPFKTSTLSRSNTPSIDGAMSRKSQTLRPSRASPFVYEPPPASQSTPKPLRPGSAMQMGKEQKLTWGRLPPPVNMRCASAAAGHLTLRPASRQSDLMMNGVSSYQSYSTLPRPEQLEPENLMEGNHVMPYFPRIISRPPSVVPGMASDFVRPPSAMPVQLMVPPPPPPVPVVPGPDPSIINWDSLNIFSIMQALVGLVIFCFGVSRTLKGAKWAVGVELLYAPSVIIAALAGIVACRKGSFSYAIFSFGLTTLNILFAVPSFLLGLFPLIPYVIPELDSSQFVSPNEPITVDISLSIAVALQQIINLVIVAIGCSCLGKVCRLAEDFKLRYDTEATFNSNVFPHTHKS